MVAARVSTCIFGLVGIFETASHLAGASVVGVYWRDVGNERQGEDQGRVCRYGCIHTG